MKPWNEGALSSWEGEGGSVVAATANGGSAHARGLPLLPPGYTAQQASGFRDSTGRFSYEFCRVYGPADAVVDQRGAVCVIDPDLSYWVVTWRIFGGASHGLPGARWMSYAQARKLSSSKLSFSQFSSAQGMRDAIPQLLRTSEIAIEPQPGATPV